MDSEETEPSEGSEAEDLRQLIMQQLVRMESSDVSDEDSYQVRLSCILEADESDNSAGGSVAQLEFPKDESVPQKSSERDKICESSETLKISEANMDDDVAGDVSISNVQVTDLDELSLKNVDGGEKTEDVHKTEKGSQEDLQGDVEETVFGFGIKKLKSSDNLFKRPFLVRRIECSSDSSDLDLSISPEVKTETLEDEAQSFTPELESSIDEPKEVTEIGEENHEIILETEVSIGEQVPKDIFLKISQTYLDKMKREPEPDNNNELPIDVISENLTNTESAPVGDEEKDVEKGESATKENSETEILPEEMIRDSDGAQSNILRENIPQIVEDLVPDRTESDEEENLVAPIIKEESVKSKVESDGDQSSLGTQPVEEDSIEEEIKKARKDDEVSLRSAVPEDEQSDCGERTLSFKDVRIRGTSPREYTPPIPPETYLWEEVKRMRGKGGYPWTYLDKPPYDDNTWKKYMDHEYEPINPPPLANVAEADKPEAETLTGSSIPETDKHFIRIPLDKELVVQEDDEENDVAIEEEAKSPEDMEVEQIAAAQELQEQIENRFLAPTPTNTTASQSRTDCDVNTSMLDSSGLEDLPLNRGSRNKKTMQSKSEQMRAQAHGIHQKLRTQAGKLRNKLRSIPKPSFNLKEKPKSNVAPQEKTKFRLPERPKFSLPERPKFNLPERPKFKFPERPKINMPAFGKSKPPKERQQQSTVSNAGSRKNLFEFDFKTYPKIFNKKSRQRGDYTTSSPKQTRGNTPPPQMRSDEPTSPERKKGPVGQRWVGRFDDIKYADADDRESESRRSEKSESLSDFRDKDLGLTEDLELARLPPGRRTVSTKSSMSHLSDREVQSSGSSEDRHRKGVLEEIDSDEFFLRQKGISQEDIDMGKYLTDEIREAFRSPVVNALAQMDYEYDDIDTENVPKEPDRPTRTRSLNKKSKKSKKEFPDDDSEHYGSYPPSRPGRKSRSQSALNDETNISETKARYANESAVQSRYENVEYEEDNASEYYKSPTSVKEYHHYKVPRKDAPVVPPTPTKRKSSSYDRIARKKTEEGWVEVEIETSVEEVKVLPPQPSLRRKSRKQLYKELSADERSIQSAPGERTSEPDYIIPAAPDDSVEAPPIPPKRMRSLSRGSRSVHSLALSEDKPQTQGASSTTDIEVKRDIKNHYEDTGDDMSFGYATITKSGQERPERQKKSKPARPPPPRKKKDLSQPSFNTLPRRGPLRPMRNYSTLGPARPPRRQRTRSVDHIYADDRQSQAYVEIGDPLRSLTTDEAHGSNKDLQTEEVIEKMKGRPLPAPPRPPRQKSRGPDETQDDLQAVETEAFVHEPPPGTEVVEEVCVATQTDPLPEDFSMEDDIDVIQEFSHEQLRVQEAFLEEMKMEEERLQEEMKSKRRSKADIENEETSKQVFKQIEEILAEEKKLLLERQKTEDRLEENKRQVNVKADQEFAQAGPSQAGQNRQFDDQSQKTNEDKAIKTQVDEVGTTDIDMGYASLDRRQLRPETESSVPSTSSPAAPLVPLQPEVSPPVPVFVPVLPDPNTTLDLLRTDKLQIRELEVGKLNVSELQADRIQVNNLQATRLTVEDIISRGGSLVVGNIELPPDFFQQILARIPWDELRPPPPEIPQAPTPTSTPVESIVPSFPTVNVSIPQFRSNRRHHQAEESEDENLFQATRRHRRHHTRQHSKYSSDEEDDDERRDSHRRHRGALQSSSITDLSKQLTRACTTAGMRAMRNFASQVRVNVQADDKTQYLQTAICIAIVVIAGFFLLGFDSKNIHHYHWDFQFPPQPPPQG